MIRLLIVSIALFTMTAACKGKRKSPHDTVKGKGVSVTYGRPFKLGRDIFGGLEKYGQVWRTGADEATEITFEKDAVFASRNIKAGTYTLFTIPNENQWTVILNSELGQWGAYDYAENKSKDVLVANVPVVKLDTVVEQLTIRFDPQNTMYIEWDKTQVQIPVESRNEKLGMKN